MELMTDGFVFGVLVVVAFHLVLVFFKSVLKVIFSLSEEPTVLSGVVQLSLSLIESMWNRIVHITPHLYPTD